MDTYLIKSHDNLVGGNNNILTLGYYGSYKLSINIVLYEFLLENALDT